MRDDFPAIPFDGPYIPFTPNEVTLSHALRDEVKHQEQVQASCGITDPEAALARIERKIDALDAKLTGVLASVDEIIVQAKPAFEQLMNSPMLAMLTGGKKQK